MTSSDRDIFQSALSDFAFEAACGGAIRHLADSGCTAKQIMEQLHFPVSAERVGKVLYQHLCNTGVILEKSPEEGLSEAKPEYVLEYDSYGKPSYRRKNTINMEEKEFGSDIEGGEWKVIACKPVSDFSEPTYISCDFGIPDSAAAFGISLLNGRQREYLEGIPWPCYRVYHKLDYRMKEILRSLCEQNAYEGICYFPKRREKLNIP